MVCCVPCAPIARPSFAPIHVLQQHRSNGLTAKSDQVKMAHKTAPPLSQRCCRGPGFLLNRMTCSPPKMPK